MQVSLLPYTTIDGIRTVPDSEIKQLFTRTAREGLDKIVFYEGTIKTEDDFLTAVKYKECLFYLVKSKKETIGYVWLNRFENHTARYHFCAFTDYWGHLEEVASTIMTTLMYMEDTEGNYFFDLLTGFIPAWNKRAIQFTLKNGGYSAGVIPNAIWNSEKQKSEDAVFIYYTRGDL